MDVIAPADAALLCACARRRSDEAYVRALIAGGPVEWDAVLRAAAAHGVTELLFEPLKDPDLGVPWVIRDRLERKVLEATGENLKRTAELALLLRHLADNGIRALAFKGPTLAAGIYGHPGRRVSSDLDIFIHRRDVTRVRPLLTSLGYQVPPALPWRSGSLLYGWFPAAGRDDVLTPGAERQTSIDVHAAFAAWRCGIQLDADELFERSIVTAVAGYDVATLHAEDLLIVLAIHGMNHCWWPLRLVSDIDAVAAFVDSWPTVVARAERAGTRRMLWVALLLAEQLLRTVLPERVVAQARRDRTAVSLADTAARRMMTLQRLPEPHRRAWLRQYLDSRRRQVGYVLRDTIHEWFLIWPWNSRPWRE